MQLDQAGFERIALGEPGQSGVECEQILIRLGRGDQVGTKFLPLTSIAVDLSTLLAGALDQDSTHRGGGGREEIPAPIPVPRVAVADQPQVRFVD